MLTLILKLFELNYNSSFLEKMEILLEAPSNFRSNVYLVTVGIVIVTFVVIFFCRYPNNIKFQKRSKIFFFGKKILLDPFCFFPMRFQDFETIQFIVIQYVKITRNLLNTAFFRDFLHK